MRQDARWNALHVAMIAAAVVAIAAAFMPWAEADVSVLSVTLYSVTVDGMERDGLFTVFMGAGIIGVVLASLYAGLSARQASIIVAILGSGIALIGFLTWIDIEGAVDADGEELEELPLVDASPAIGLILTTAAGIAAAVLGLAGVRFAAGPVSDPAD